VPLSEQEKNELRAAAGSESLREDFQRMACSRRTVFLEGGCVDADRVLDFLCAYNEFINHAPRRFRPIQDGDMRF